VGILILVISEQAMPTAQFSPVSCIGTLTRSFLLSLGFDHLFIDFLAHTAVGAAGVLMAILFVGLRTRRRS
jgi:hypothetical protein